MTAEQTAGYAWQVGLRGAALITSVAVAGAETRGTYDPNVLGDIGLEDAKWGPSIGIWQIRTLKADTGTGSSRDLAHLTGDPNAQALAMWTISSGGTNWRPWSTYLNGAYRAYMAEATAAAQRVAAAGGPINMGLVPVPGSNLDRGIISAGAPLVLRPHEPVDPGSIMVNGAPLGSLGDAVIAGSVDLTTDSVMQVVLTFSDPGLQIAASGLFTVGLPVEWDGMRLAVSKVASGQGDGGETVTVTAWPAGVLELMSRPGITVQESISAAAWVVNEATKAGFDLVLHDDGPERPGVGPDTVGQVTVPETAWQTMQRLASEEGVWMWADSLNALVFKKPVAYVEQTQLVKVGWRGALGDPALDAIECPDCETVFDNAIFSDTATVQLPRWWGEQIRPGMALQIAGVPIGNVPGNVYIVTRVNWSLNDLISPVTVEAKVPVDPIPTSPYDPQLPPVALNTPVSKGTRLAVDFVTWALKQAGKTYLYGASVQFGSDDPQAFDCSSLVEWAANEVGVTLPRTSGAQYAACKAAGTTILIDQAAHTRGALLFVGKDRAGQPDGNQHVAISLGDGSFTIEARGRAYGVNEEPISNIRWDAAALIPGMIYGVGSGTGAGGAAGRFFQS